jgi:hypothetical protein
MSILRSLAAAAIAAAIGLGAGFGPATSAAADEAPNVYVILTSPDNQTQGMALVLTTQMVEQGQSARVLLCDAAGQLGLAAYDPPKLAPRDVSPKDMLMGLMQRGVPVEVCALFLPNSQYGEADLAPGVTVAAPPAVAGMLAVDGVRWFTF